MAPQTLPSGGTADAHLTAAPFDADTQTRDAAFYRTLVEGMNEGVLVRDATGVITYATCRILRSTVASACETWVGWRP